MPYRATAVPAITSRSSRVSSLPPGVGDGNFSRMTAKQDEGHRQPRRQQTARPGHGEPGPSQIDGRVQPEIAVHRCVVQLPPAVRHQVQQQGKCTDQHQSQHRHCGDDGGQHCRSPPPTPAFLKNAALKQPVQAQGPVQAAQSSVDPPPEPGKDTVVRLRLLQLEQGGG